MLTPAEREAINSGQWFCSLSPSLRHDILRQATVRRLKDGALIYARGDVPHRWYACAQGAVRMSSTSLSGRQTTLAYVEPGATLARTRSAISEPWLTPPTLVAEATSSGATEAT